MIRWRSNEDGEEELLIPQPPAWLQSLMLETFFSVCSFHPNSPKNEKNTFCLHCCQSFCPCCLPSHNSSHSLLQVRRYVYQNVIRLDELEKVIDCSWIQAYTINCAKVIFLNRQRAQSRSCYKIGDSANTCFTCCRVLQDPFNFCSLTCKVDHLVYQGEDLSIITYMFNRSELGISEFEGLHVDGSESPPNSNLDYLLEYGGSNYGMEDSKSLESGHSRKQGRMFLPRIMLSLGNRRKGATPRRSPLS